MFSSSEYEGIKNEKLFSTMRTFDVGLCENLKAIDFHDPIKRLNNFIENLKKDVQVYVRTKHNTEANCCLHILDKFIHHNNGLVNLYCDGLMLKNKKSDYSIDLSARLIRLVHDLNYSMIFIEKVLNKNFPTKIEWYNDGHLSLYEAVEENNELCTKITKL